MRTLTTDYIGKADTSVDTIMLDNGNICYLYNKDGYTSVIPNLESLIKFLDGDTGVRLCCFESHSEAEIEEMISGFEKIFSE